MLFMLVIKVIIIEVLNDFIVKKGLIVWKIHRIIDKKIKVVVLDFNKVVDFIKMIEIDNVFGFVEKLRVVAYLINRNVQKIEHLNKENYLVVVILMKNCRHLFQTIKEAVINIVSFMIELIIYYKEIKILMKIEKAI